MRRNIYRKLPLESLYELLYSSVRSLLNALDPKEGSPESYKGVKKQDDLIMEAIEEKLNEKEIKLLP